MGLYPLLSWNQNAIPNAHGNVTTHIAPPFATQFANPLSAILHALNPKTPFVTSNAKNPNVNQSAKNLNVTGNVINPLALNPSVNSFVKTLTVSPRLNAANAKNKEYFVPKKMIYFI